LAQEPKQILSANVGCITHLQEKSPVPVKHWIEALDEALNEVLNEARMLP
jgi:glycolate oxidase iron-sulfur subunit